VSQHSGIDSIASTTENKVQCSEVQACCHTCTLQFNFQVVFRLLNSELELPVERCQCQCQYPGPVAQGECRRDERLAPLPVLEWSRSSRFPPGLGFLRCTLHAARYNCARPGEGANLAF
jgi:hypothetical protein